MGVIILGSPLQPVNWPIWRTFYRFVGTGRDLG